MSFVLPFPDKPHSRQQITLDDVPYALLLTWNERAQAWSFGLEDRDGQGVIYGRRIVLQMDMLAGYRYLPGMPTGGMFALDTRGKATSISMDDMTSGLIELRYFTRAELDVL